MMLREYQRRALDQLEAWFLAGHSGNPCLVLPTGSGKSHIIAAFCKEALQEWPETRVLMLTHVKELIQQNAEKMLQHWPGAPMGIYSAGIGRRQLGEPITFAGIQSVRDKAGQIGHVDIVIIDECHMVSHQQTGGYRTLIDELAAINPRLRVIGLSATPWRLGHGVITDKPALFDAPLIEPVTIEELIAHGYLAPLRSKVTAQKLDVSGVHKRHGEYIESELQAAVDRPELNADVVSEIMARAEDRKAWLIFCAGVDHAHHVADELLDRGVEAACITGTTPKKERAELIAAFRAGRLRALTNANVLTTGFDYPDIDLIAMLRPTMSPALYVQMAGRGLRPKSHTDHCLVLDFAGVVETHGPITAVQPPRRKGATDDDQKGEAPTKVCQNCGELAHAASSFCPSCGAAFPEPEGPDLLLRDIDIMGIEPSSMPVEEWAWRRHTSRTSGIDMLRVTYYGPLGAPPVHEYLTVMHDGYAGQKAVRTMMDIALRSGVAASDLPEDLDAVALMMTRATPPDHIEFRMDGKFHRVTRRIWDAPSEAGRAA